MHDLTLIVTLAGGLAFALLLGTLTRRLGLSTLVGYMLAGIVVGPNTPGFVADQSLASQLSEIGVILLMFGVGQHFHPQELLRVWRLAVPGAVAQSLVAGVAGWAAARAFGWSHAAGAVFGMSLAVASTVVLMRMLVERDRLSSRDGHVAVGWLIVEDLFTVAALVVLPVLASDSSDAQSLGGALLLAMGKVAAFVAIVMLVGTRVVGRLLERVAGARSAELFTLTVFVVALGVAVLASELFHVSVALGAFFAGLVVGQSRFGPQAAADMAPFRDVFTALFFVSVGMLFNPNLVVQQPALVLTALGVVLLLKPLVAVVIVLLLRSDWRTAATVGVGLAQIGEFSFILASLGLSLGVIPKEALDVLVVAAIVSIALNPVLFRLVERWLPKERGSAPEEEVPLASTYAPDAPGAAVVLAGYRSLGRRVVQRCAAAGIPLCVVQHEAIEALEGLPPGVAQIYGDPGRPDVLAAAGLGQAHMLVVADMPLVEKMQVCRAARQLNPRVEIVGAAMNDAEAAWLRDFGAEFVVDALDEQTEQITRAIRARL
ncbi:cation:proton antiporter [Methylibium petroleiphilum]|uniref:cation:proton antiporter n=1 Tax=Methylibium petroleiphilum TaxID=105560 RepID=UPI001AC801F5|nr:cation:proton antiporter [Methylibium petroleiphilum]MBN9206023.1 cation:proton antiporter [Methylibium petroleiphilum]